MHIEMQYLKSFIKVSDVGNAVFSYHINFRCIFIITCSLHLWSVQTKIKLFFLHRRRYSNWIWFVNNFILRWVFINLWIISGTFLTNRYYQNFNNWQPMSCMVLLVGQYIILITAHRRIRMLVAWNKIFDQLFINKEWLKENHYI